MKVVSINEMLFIELSVTETDDEKRVYRAKTVLIICGYPGTGKEADVPAADCSTRCTLFSLRHFRADWILGFEYIPCETIPS